jgi:hypothetical protein
VWLTVVGNRGVYPVATIDYAMPQIQPAYSFALPAPVADVPYTLEPAAQNVWTSRVWQMALLLAVLFGVAHLFALRAVCVEDTSRWPFGVRRLPMFARCIDPKLRREQLGYLLGLAWTLFAAYGVVVALAFARLVAIGPTRAIRPPVEIRLVIDVVAQVGVVVVMLFLLGRIAVLWHERWKTDPKTPRARAPLFLLPVVAIGSVVWFVALLMHWEESANPLVQVLVLEERYADLGSGTTPLLPFALVLGAAYLWCLSNLDRVHMLDALHQVDPAKALRVPGARELLKTLSSPLHGARWWSIALLIAPVAVFLIKPVSTLEGACGDWLFRIALAVPCVVTGIAMLWSLRCWSALRAVLRRIAVSSIGAALARLPPESVRRLEAQLATAGPSVRDLVIPVRCLCELADRELDVASVDDSEEARACIARAAEVSRVLLRGEAAANVSPANRWHLSTSGAAAAIATGYAHVEKILQSADALRSPDAPRPMKDDDKESAASTLELYAREELAPHVLWLRLARDLQAIRAAWFVGQLVPVFRILLALVVGGALLTLLAFTSYVFEPHRLLATYAAAVVLGAVAITLLVLVQMDRDETLSRIARTPPGRITLDGHTVVRLVSWTALPILSLLAVHYPGLGDGLMQWFETLVTALR